MSTGIVVDKMGRRLADGAPRRAFTASGCPWFTLVAMSSDERPDPRDRGRWPNPGAPTLYGLNWKAQTTEYAPAPDGVAPWAEALPGPAPAQTVTATTAPPAYRVWADDVEMPGGAA